MCDCDFFIRLQEIVVKDLAIQVTYRKNLAKNVDVVLDYKNLDETGDQTKDTLNVSAKNKEAPAENRVSIFYRYVSGLG